MWLLSKNRSKEALQSLQWLRGWVPAKNVEKEFAEMQRYNVHSNSCGSCQKSKSICEHPPPTLKQKLQELIRKRNLKPFTLALLCFAFSQFIGIGLFLSCLFIISSDSNTFSYVGLWVIQVIQVENYRKKNYSSGGFYKLWRVTIVAK